MATAGEIPPATVPAPPRPGYAGGARETTTTYAPASERYGGSAPGGAGGSYEERLSVGSLHIPGASTMYSILGLILLIGAILALIMPYRLTDVVFRQHRAYYDVVFEELWRLLAGTFLAAACASYALKVASDRRMLNDPTVQRLQLGFFWFALLAIILHLVHVLLVKSLTFWGLLIGAVAMAPALLVPTVHLSMSGGFGLATAASSVTTALGNVFAPRRVTFTLALYSLLTVLFSLAGLSYLILPKLTLKWAFGYHAGKRAIFMWQWLGAGMLFLFPAMTYTCLERGIEGLLSLTMPKALNVGLLVASLFHILEFGAVLSAEGTQGRWMLPVLFGHWLLTLLASILGLAAREHGAPVYEYEPLRSEGAV